MIKSEYKIVIPIKFSLSCERLVESINAFKTDTKFKLYAISVYSKDSNEKKELEKLNKWLREKELHAEAVVKQGEVAEEIMNFSYELDASAILLNKETNEEYSTQSIGDISIKIIEKSKIPVVIFKNSLGLNEISSILLPLDVTLENKKKISNAIFFSHFFNGALIRLMCVVFDVNDYTLNRYIYQLQHLVNFIERSGCDCTGEIMRCSMDEGDSIGKAVVDYAERSEAEIVLLLTDDEEYKGSSKLHPASAYMLAHLSNNIITLTP